MDTRSLRYKSRPASSLFEFTRCFARVSRAPRNLIGYSGRDTLTAQDSMSTSRKACGVPRECAHPAELPVPIVSLTVGYYRDYRQGQG